MVSRVAGATLFDLLVHHILIADTKHGIKSPIFYFERGTTILRSVYYCTRNLYYGMDSTTLEMNAESKIEYVLMALNRVLSLSL